MVSKVVLYGATGEIGPYLAKAIAQKGHDTTAVIRAATKQANSKKIDALKAAGVKIVEGDLIDVTEAELVAFLRNFEVVVSAVSITVWAQQPKLIKAAAKAGIKRFFPSEFGHDADAGYPLPLEMILGPKEQARRLLEKSGMEYTFVVSHMFAAWAVPALGDIVKGQAIATEVDVLDGGNNKAMIIVEENNIGQYTAAAIDDLRAANKTLYLAPPANSWWSQNELIDLYEKLSGKTVKRNPVSKEAQRRKIDEEIASNPLSAAFDEMNYFLWIDQYYKREQQEVEASALYPEIKVVTIEQYMTKMIKAAASEAAH